MSGNPFTVNQSRSGFFSDYAFNPRDSLIKDNYPKRNIVKIHARIDYLDNSLELELEVHKDNTVSELLDLIVKKIPRYGLEHDELIEKSKIIVNNKILDDHTYIGQVYKSSVVECIVTVDLETKAVLTSAYSEPNGE